MTTLDPPFGTYALPGQLERLRTTASGFPMNRIGRWAVSLLRKACLVSRAEPVDVEVYPTIFARIYPSTNRCEKRIFAGPQFFDRPERMSLANAIAKSDVSGTFQFLDLGANVGLYSLWVVSEGRRMKRKTSVVAVEPDKTTGSRLVANIKASGAENEIKVAACGVGGRSGSARMIEDSANRGGNHIDLVEMPQDEDGVFKVFTIPEICDEHGISRIDALKIDVEGHDYAALEALFKSGRNELFPEWIQAEIGREQDKESELVRLCVENGYSVSARTKLNAIMLRDDTRAADEERS